MSKYDKNHLCQNQITRPGKRIEKVKEVQKKIACLTTRCRGNFPMILYEPKLQKRKHLTALGRYEIMSAQQISKLSWKKIQAQGGSLKCCEEKKMDKENKIIIHYSKISLGKTALWAGE